MQGPALRVEGALQDFDKAQEAVAKGETALEASVRGMQAIKDNAKLISNTLSGFPFSAECRKVWGATPLFLGIVLPDPRIERPILPARP